MIRLLAVTFLVLSAQVGAQSLHVFKDGETIDAARFNDNFTALKDAISSGGSPSDGAAYGSPVWVDSNGALLTGRGSDLGQSILWRVNGRLETIGGVNPSNTYTPNVMRYYSSGNCDPSSFLGITLQSDSMWVEGGVLKTEGPLINSTELVFSILFSESNGGDCRSMPGDSSSGVHEVSDTGVAAPSWTTDSTQMFADLR